MTNNDINSTAAVLGGMTQSASTGASSSDDSNSNPKKVLLPFKKGELLSYTKYSHPVKVIIHEVYYDDDMIPYYSIKQLSGKKWANGSHIKDTISKYLYHPSSKEAMRSNDVSMLATGILRRSTKYGDMIEATGERYGDNKTSGPVSPTASENTINTNTNAQKVTEYLEFPPGPLDLTVKRLGNTGEFFIDKVGSHCAFRKHLQGGEAIEAIGKWNTRDKSMKEFMAELERTNQSERVLTISKYVDAGVYNYRGAFIVNNGSSMSRDDVPVSSSHQKKRKVQKIDLKFPPGSLGIMVKRIDGNFIIHAVGDHCPNKHKLEGGEFVDKIDSWSTKGKSMMEFKSELARTSHKRRIVRISRYV